QLVGTRAKDLLVTGNLRLVMAQARRLLWKSQLELVDLVQEGVVGLMRAIDGFDPYWGFSLTTYAVPWIRQTIQRAMHDQARMVRLPVHVSEVIDRLKKLAEDANVDFEEASPQEIVEMARAAGQNEVTVEKVASYQAASA